MEPEVTRCSPPGNSGTRGVERPLNAVERTRFSARPGAIKRGSLRFRKPLLKITTSFFLCLGSGHLGADTGLLNLSVEENSGKVFLLLDELPAEYLYVPALQSGAGSNDLGLDRGKLDRTRLVRFERYGNRVLLLEPNFSFRADNAGGPEQRAVNEAFAQSVLAGFPVEQTDGDDGVRIDLTPLLLSDITRISTRITESNQGEFTLDAERSAVDTSGVHNFENNTLIPVILTFAGKKPGSFISDVTPTPDSLTVNITHQFVRLPDSGYRARAFHPRSGYFALRYRDYAAPLNQSIEKRLIYRHRLTPGETLKYYVDNGTPEPVRSALIEGASWWKAAFEEAGFENGFSVEVLPENADPLDVRFNVIQWVHRSTRGWSYGSSVADPRTGEIIKGHVSLGSLRVRQDQMIAEALTAPFTSPEALPEAAREMALARLRQLSAHEVGHTLGIDHNFAASASGDASVMDYPHPNLYLDDLGQVRLDRAYARGVSPWDRLVVRYGYSIFSDGQEATGLNAILEEADQGGIAFINDRDARVPGSAHPGAHLWDNGTDVFARLGEILTIRKTGLEQFSPAVLSEGTPLFEMERRLVPVYLLHRYQLEATAKLLGGLYYDYGLKEDRPSRLEPIEAAIQFQALDAMIDLLRPGRLALPESLHYLIPPAPSGYERDREFFSGHTGISFDHFSPVRAGADLVLENLLQPQRLARLAEQQAINPDLPGIQDVMEALLDVSWSADRPGTPYLRAVKSEMDWRVLRGLMSLSDDPSAGDSVRESTTAILISLAAKLNSRAKKGDAHSAAARYEIQKFLDRPPAVEPLAPPSLPPGPPIG